MLRGSSGDLVIKSVDNNYSYEDGLLIDKNNNTLIRCQSKSNKLEIPNSIKVIGDSAFAGSTYLQQIVIPESVTKIDGAAFVNCTSLQKVVIPESVTEIGEFAFEGCTALQNVVIPDSVTEIGDSAFLNCRCLQEIVLPKSLAVNVTDLDVISTCKVICKE